MSQLFGAALCLRQAPCADVLTATAFQSTRRVTSAMSEASILASWMVDFSPAFALAAVAVVGYFLGRRYRPPADPVASQTRREIRRAQIVARDLDAITENLRRSLTRH